MIIRHCYYSRTKLGPCGPPSRLTSVVMPLRDRLREAVVSFTEGTANFDPKVNLHICQRLLSVLSVNLHLHSPNAVLAGLNRHGETANKGSACCVDARDFSAISSAENHPGPPDGRTACAMLCVLRRQRVNMSEGSKAPGLAVTVQTVTGASASSSGAPWCAALFAPAPGAAPDPARGTGS